MKQSLAWIIVLIICLQAVRRAQPDSLYWLYVYGKPSLSSSGTDTRGAAWLPWARWVLGPVPLPPLGHQRLQARGKGCRQCCHPWAEGSPPTILCPGLGHRGWCGVPASQGLLKTELPKQCVCGLACVSWDPLMEYPTPSPFEDGPREKSALLSGLLSLPPCFLDIQLIRIYLFRPVETNRSRVIFSNVPIQKISLVRQCWMYCI